MIEFPKLGIGIGWRPELALAIDRMPALGFVEITAENFPDDRLPQAIHQLRERGVRIIPHGISLSLGGADPLQIPRVRRLDRIARACDAPLVSEHIAFVRAAGVEIGHLTPLPRTREAINVVCRNVKMALEYFSTPLALENVAAVFDWPRAEIDESQFIAEILQRTNAMFLLDVSNLYANARNLGTDPIRFIESIPLNRIAYIHMGGGIEINGVYRDTHAHPVPDEAMQLLTEVCARIDTPGVMLERDDDFPSEAELRDEIGRISIAIERGRARREVVSAIG